MKFFIKKIYLISFLIIILLYGTETFSKNTKLEYSQADISNYFSGIVSINQNYTTAGFKYLNKVRSLKNTHSNFNIQFIRSLILLEKFEKAFAFSEHVWDEDKLFFESDLLLGLNYFIKKNYPKAEKHFKRLNSITRYNSFFEDLLGNILISWVKASENNKNNSFEFLDKIPKSYDGLVKINDAFLQCYFDTSKTEVAFEKIISNSKTGVSRYNYFLANYFISKNQNLASKILISKSESGRAVNSSLLLKEVEGFILSKEKNKAKIFFDCHNPNDAIAEIFYVIASLYSAQEDYQLSNFYLKISLFLNNKFTPNKTLLADNFFNEKKYEFSKKVYDSIRSIGPVHSWYAAINLATILSKVATTEQSILSLEKEFNLLSNPDFEHYYDLANFYKDYEHYEESIEYYSLALKNIKKDHSLIPKILDRRGTSYERLGEWEKAEKDLLQSLKILPDQPHVLNYLAYSWVEKKINITRALEMLKKAAALRQNDGYIIDSLGWANYVDKNYVDAEKFLQKAVELMPLDPIINDHYADVLWMVNKNIQARYFWKYVLSLDDAKQELKDSINKKLIFGIKKKS